LSITPCDQPDAAPDPNQQDSSENQAKAENEHVGTSIRWGDVFGDLTIASAMIDRIVHHAEVISLKGNSYRLKKHQPDASTAQ
jgi:IstB-like ATP binding protein